jgi:hypothetical protein
MNVVIVLVKQKIEAPKGYSRRFVSVPRGCLTGQSAWSHGWPSHFDILQKFGVETRPGSTGPPRNEHEDQRDKSVEGVKTDVLSV